MFSIPRRLTRPLLLAALSAPFLPAHSRGADADKDDPAVELRSFHIADGFEISLFASERDGIVKPVQMRWDPRGRLWVSCIPSYPQPKPDEKPDDRIVVLEDSTRAGHADRSTVFARGLLMPLGLELGAGGLYVLNGNDLVHLSDSTGGLHAKQQTPVLRGFFTGDSHQDINSFIWGPGGELMFCQGLHAFSRVETPWGIERLDKAGVWRYRPRTGRLDPFLGSDRGPQNPWGVVFDDWGQPIMTAGNGQGVYYLLPAMIRTDHFLDPKKIDDTNNIKFCGVDILGSKALPADVQGRMVAGSILNNSVYWFKMEEDGSGFHARDLPPLLTSSSPDFRAVDVKVGPDGAIYIADWYNPIIGHYQASLRHPDRDHTHGRIWRIAAKGATPIVQPDFSKLSLDELFDQLRSPERWTRYQTKRLLADHDGKEVCDALTKWIARLDPKDVQYEHLLFEAIGVFEAHEIVNAPLFDQLLTAKDYRARAYAVGVVAHWHDRLNDPLAMVRRAANDESPRVRVAAVVAASYLTSPNAIEAALDVTDRPIDRFINEALIQTTAALKPYWRPAFEAGQLTFDNKSEHIAALSKADGSADVLQSLLKTVQAGKLSGESRAGAVALLAEVGTPNILSTLFADPANHSDPAIFARCLQGMATNFRLHRVRPTGDAVQLLQPLFASSDVSVQQGALALAGLWRVEALRANVEAIARDAKAADVLREAAAEALADLGGNASIALLKDLSKPFQGTARSRAITIAALSRVDVSSAASQAAALLEEPGGAAEAPRVIHALLIRQGGSDALADSINSLKSEPSKDSAKLCLRVLSAAGGQNGKLWEVLSKAAGNSGAKLEYDPKLVQAIAAEAQKSGNPAAGERVFRSAMTNCFACHSIGGAGGRTGPDLAPVGTALPIDLIVESVLWPQRQIKEGYTATLVQTKDGDALQGYHVSEDKGEYVLREPATGRLIHIPVSNIKARRDIGSLMPDGLTDSLTHPELIDLVRFLSELGKPGPYRVPAAPLIRTWETAPVVGDIATQTPPADPAQWTTRFAMTSGELPLSEISPSNAGVWIRCSVNVVKAGKFDLQIGDAGNVRAFIDGGPVAMHEPLEVELAVGRHVFAFAVDPSKRKVTGISCQISPAAGSSGEARLEASR